VNRGEIGEGMESISWDILFQSCLKLYESYHGLVVRPKSLSLASFYSILRWNQMLTEVVVNPEEYEHNYTNEQLDMLIYDWMALTVESNGLFYNHFQQFQRLLSGCSYD
jgi:hypothetical protein